MLNGFLIIDKKKGVTSAKVVQIIKHLLYELDQKDTKIGHFGTLDPDGEGVLPIALGRATRLFGYQDDKKKVYYTEFRFGLSTDTLDTSGVVLDTTDSIPDLDRIILAAKEMIGKQLQIPPQYSAKSVDGNRAYKMARKGVLIEIPPKEIEIFDIYEITKLSKEVFSMKISVSSGTYIRSIARDIGNKLNSLCVMQYIKRLQNGIFHIEDSVTLDLLNQINLQQMLLPIDVFLTDFPRFDVPEELEYIMLTGSKLFGLSLPKTPFSVYCKNCLIGIGEQTSDGLLKLKTRLI